jgi:hypothetical protein
LTSSVAYVISNNYDIFDILLAIDPEWYTASDELIGHDSETPDIHPLIIGLSPNNLRGEI